MNSNILITYPTGSPAPYLADAFRQRGAQVQLAVPKAYLTAGALISHAERLLGPLDLILNLVPEPNPELTRNIHLSDSLLSPLSIIEFAASHLIARHSLTPDAQLTRRTPTVATCLTLIPSPVVYVPVTTLRRNGLPKAHLGATPKYDPEVQPTAVATLAALVHATRTAAAEARAAPAPVRFNTLIYDATLLTLIDAIMAVLTDTAPLKNGATRLIRPQFP